MLQRWPAAIDPPCCPCAGEEDVIAQPRSTKKASTTASGQEEEAEESDADSDHGGPGAAVEPASSSDGDDGLLAQKRLEDLSEDDFGSDEDPEQLEALALQLK